MITKTYKAESLSQAIEIIKREMGQKASIISTKTTTKKRGWFRAPQRLIEVTAKVDEKYLTREQLKMVGAMVDAISMKKGADKLDKTDKPEGVKVSLSQKAKERVVQVERQRPSEQGRGEDFKRELLRAGEDQEQEVQDMTGGRAVPDDELAEIDHLLEEQGVSSEVIAQWQGYHLGSARQGAGDDPLDLCLDFFLNKIRIDTAGLPRVIGLVGPRGGGKSLTVLKLASLLQREEKKVAIFTLDNPEGTLTPLRQQAKERGVPFCELNQVEDYQRLIKEYQNFDHILVDTRALPSGDAAGDQAMQAQLKQVGATCLAVFSARDLEGDGGFRGYKDLDVAGLILTKIDGLHVAGPVYNFLDHVKLPVAFFGIGTDIDEDIEKASSERLVSILFGVGAEE